jgi:hypothetical protein
MHRTNYPPEFEPDPQEIDSNLWRRIFYHGTSKRAARKILAHGLRDYSITAETPLLKYKAARGIDRWFHGGAYGRGTYITCNWRSALYFGPVLFRMELQPGTRIVRLDPAPDPKVIDTLTREFGREILRTSPWKVIPRNKRLTLNEAIQLARYHRSKDEADRSLFSPASKHEAVMFDLRKILVRFGIHGWGEATDLNGIVIFATDRLKPAEVILSVPTLALRDEARDPGRCYREYDSLAAFVTATRTAGNPGATISRAWVDAANTHLNSQKTKLNSQHSPS